MTITATFNQSQSCAICGSVSFAITPNGFTVCRKCGCEAEIENLSNKISIRDYNENKMPKQYAVMSKVTSTCIGHAGERRSADIKRLQKWQEQSSRSYKTTIQIAAYREISRLVSKIGLSETLTENLVKCFLEVWQRIPKGKKARTPEVLAPIVLYRCARIFKYVINLKSVLSHAKCNKHEFNAAFTATYKLFEPRDKKDVTAEIIKTIVDMMHMPEIVLTRALEMLQVSSKLRNTTVGISAAACVGISVLSLKLKVDYAMYKICESIHVPNSSVNAKILEVFKCKRSMALNQLAPLIPRLYGKLMLASKKNAHMQRIQDEIIARIMRSAEEMNMPADVRGRAICILRANLKTLGMTTPDVAAGTCVMMAVLAMSRRPEFRLYQIANSFETAASSITARMYKVLQSRGIKVDYHIYELEEIMPHIYGYITGQTKRHPVLPKMSVAPQLTA